MPNKGLYMSSALIMSLVEIRQPGKPRLLTTFINCFVIGHPIVLCICPASSASFCCSTLHPYILFLTVLMSRVWLLLCSYVSRWYSLLLDCLKISFVLCLFLPFLPQTFFCFLIWNLQCDSPWCWLVTGWLQCLICGTILYLIKANLQSCLTCWYQLCNIFS